MYILTIFLKGTVPFRFLSNSRQELNRRELLRMVHVLQWCRVSWCAIYYLEIVESLNMAINQRLHYLIRVEIKDPANDLQKEEESLLRGLTDIRLIFASERSRRNEERSSVKSKISSV